MTDPTGTLAERLSTSPTVIDLFAGPGGWDEGMLPLGITARGIDNNLDACETGRAAGHYRVEANVATLDPRVAADTWGPPVGIVASPPCQGFSPAGRGHGRRDSRLLLDRLAEVDNLAELVRQIAELDRAMSDDRSLLALEPLRWALALGPRWLAWEQVPAVLPLWDACAVILRGIGYSVTTGIVHAEQYGVPQSRTRAVLVARDTEATIAHGPATLPAPTHSRYHTQAPDRIDPGMPRWVSMGEALGLDTGNGLAIRSNYGTGGDPAARGVRTADQPAASVTGKVGRNYWMHAAGATSVPGRPRRLDQPAATITGKGTAAWGDGTGNGATIRRVTVEEAAVFQSFRRDYPWRGDSTSQYQQVGNAVPPVLARAIVAAVAV